MCNFTEAIQIINFGSSPHFASDISVVKLTSVIYQSMSRYWLSTYMRSGSFFRVSALESKFKKIYEPPLLVALPITQ